MISAAIFNAHLEPISEFIDIESDSEFDQLEQMATSFAEDGTKCCIRWSRDTDGQVAYWGPNGAALKPHWYAKPGRPSEMQDGKRVNVYLDAQSLELAAEFGNGNVSEGIRKALSGEV